MPVWLQVFVESAWASSLIPLSYESTLAGARNFGAENLPSLIFVAFVGAVLGQTVNYGFGHWLRRQHWFSLGKLKPEQMDKAQNWFAAYGKWLILLAAAPVGQVVMLAAGFFAVRFRLALMLAAISEAFALAIFLSAAP